MKNKEKFIRTYNEIQAPEALVGKVMGMNKVKKEFKTRNIIKYAVSILAIVTLTFAASNGICYAATGETLITKITVRINGQETRQEVQWTKEEDVYQGQVVIPVEDENFSANIVLDAEKTESFDTEIFVETGERVTEDGRVEEERITLEIGDNQTVNAVTVEKEETVE